MPKYACACCAAWLTSGGFELDLHRDGTLACILMDADEAAVTAADGRACGCMNPTQSGKTASMECTI